MIFEGKQVEVFEFEGKVLFNPYHVGECLDLGESAVRMAIKKMNQNQVVKLKNPDVKDIDIRKLNNAMEINVKKLILLDAEYTDVVVSDESISKFPTLSNLLKVSGKGFEIYINPDMIVSLELMDRGKTLCKFV